MSRSNRPPSRDGQTQAEPSRRGKQEKTKSKSSDADGQSTITWQKYVQIEKLAFRCAEHDTAGGRDLDPHTMTPDQLKRLIPSKQSAKKLVELAGGNPRRMIKNLFFGAYKQRLIELLRDAQAAAGMCVEKGCRRPVKRLGDHSFRRCPAHTDGRLRKLGRS